uniref:Glutaredoxin domain-containing protein n=1 Tax=Timema bartmani TaxID=61472 RepID=A0A7R9FBN8_9NEOP|nr:unnamed protein product [Timema bartmani]
MHTLYSGPSRQSCSKCNQPNQHGVVSWQVISPTDHTGLQLVLFQYPTCPFCCKVRAFLDYYGFSYDVVEVNPVLRQQIRWSSYKKVPIVVAKVEGGYQQLNDSSLIVSSLASYLHDSMGGLPNVLKCYPTINFNDDDGSLRSEIMNRYFLMFQGDVPTGRTKENITEECRCRKWVDDRLVHVLSQYCSCCSEERRCRKWVDDSLVHVLSQYCSCSSEERRYRKWVDDSLVHVLSQYCSCFREERRWWKWVDDRFVHVLSQYCSCSSEKRRYRKWVADSLVHVLSQYCSCFREERRWRKWVDDRLVHVLSPNVYRTKEEALQAFHWFSEVGEWDKLFSPWERSLVIYVGACAMWLIGKRLKKRHNLKDDVRVSLYDECNNWLKALRKQGTPYLGGQFPNLADLAVFGVLNSIEGCSAFQDLLDNTRIGTWYQLMKDQCQGHAGSALMGL